MTAHSDEGCGADVDGIRSQRDGFHDIGAAADGTSSDDGHLITNAFLAQAGVNSSDGQLDGYADVVSNGGGRSSRAAAQAINGDVIRTGARDTTGDRGHVVHGCDLDPHRLLVVGGLF